jgi:hypothetical protein
MISAIWKFWKRVWAGWSRLMHTIGNFQARVLLSLLYAIIVLPFGLSVRWFADPLRMKHRPSQWLENTEQAATNLEWARRQ